MRSATPVLSGGRRRVVAACPASFERLFLLVPAQQYVGQFLSSFKEFPPSQKVGSFGIDQVMVQLQSAPKGGN